MPTLGGITPKVVLFDVTYFVAPEALGLVENLGNISDFSGKARLILVLPVSLLDACFIVWIFSSLSQTLEKLQVLFFVHAISLYTSLSAVPSFLHVLRRGYIIFLHYQAI